MTHQQIVLVKSTWSLVAAMDPLVVGELFYTRLFETAPEVKPLFRGPMPGQYRKLMAMLSYIILRLDQLDDIVDEVSDLAKRHVHYGVKAAYFTPVGASLLWTLEQGLGEKWNAETKEAWTICYHILSSAMIGAMESHTHQAA